MKRLPRGIRSTHYRRGTVLWHGTSHETGIVDLRGPMWVSDSREVARWFSSWRLDTEIEGAPVARFRPKRTVARVLKFEVVTPFSLPTFDARGGDVFDAGDFSAWLERLAGRDDKDISAEDVCAAGYVGWRLVMNYDTGDDIMLCEPEKYLRRVPARGLWRP